MTPTNIYFFLNGISGPPIKIINYTPWIKKVLKPPKQNLWKWENCSNLLWPPLTNLPLLKFQPRFSLIFLKQTIDWKLLNNCWPPTTKQINISFKNIIKTRKNWLRNVQHLFTNPPKKHSKNLYLLYSHDYSLTI